MVDELPGEEGKLSLKKFQRAAEDLDVVIAATEC
jgi:hypothetical protein